MTTKDINAEDDSVPVEVELGKVIVKRSTAIWLCEHSLAHGDDPNNMAGNILDDVAEADMAMHSEPVDGTLH